MLLHKQWLRSFPGPLSRQLLTSPTTASRYWQVSSHGRICNPAGAISFGSASPSGYFRVGIRGEYFYVHRVVADAFLGPPLSEEAWQVNHKDGNPGNNHVANLEYVTASENQRHSYATGTRRCSGPMRWKPVMYRAVGSKVWTASSSITAAALELGVSQSAASQACLLQKPLKGYELRATELHEPELSGEEWRPMLCPVSRQEVAGRLVSSLGRLRTCSGLVHNGCMSSTYPFTKYRTSFGFRTETVHRLVALAFLGPPPSSDWLHVNHKDEDKQNNAVSNLEYVTPAENRAHYLKNRRAETGAECRSNSKPVWSRAYNSADEWTWHPSMSSAADTRRVHRRSVSRSLQGKQRRSGGYEFQAVGVMGSIPGEEWREVNLAALVEEKRKRTQALSRK